jgi:hypothetical protein
VEAVDSDLLERTCVVCPAQLLQLGQFDVADRPSPSSQYDPARGYRVDASGTAVCVHPYRVGLPPGRYASAGEPLPAPESPAPPPTTAALELPDELDDLEGWLVALLRTSPDTHWDRVLVQAETTACQRFSDGAVVEAMRRVLAYELTRQV